MNIINPSYEILNIPDPMNHDEVLMHLERIGRVCYKSEDKITIGSANNFIKNLLNRKHWAMLEHYTFVLSVPESVYTDINTLLKDSAGLTDSDLLMKYKFINRTEWYDTTNSKYQYIISFSPTVLNYIYECKITKLLRLTSHGIMQVIRFMRKHYPELFSPAIDERETSGVCNESIEFLSRDEIKSLPNWIREIHDTMTVNFTIDRGVAAELVRHRPASFAHESTRYCNYTKGKFSNEITVIKPCFFEEGSPQYTIWRHSCETAERDYILLVASGALPQQARDVLPLSLKGDLIVTTNLHEWNHIFAMRCDMPAHPQMREIMCPLMLESNNSEYYKNMFDKNIHLLPGGKNK